MVVLLFAGGDKKYMWLILFSLAEFYYFSTEITNLLNSVNMKKLLLFGLAVALGFSVNAQKLRQGLQEHQAIQKMAVAYGPEKPSTLTHDLYKPNYDGKSRFVSIIDIGTSANAYSYGYSGGQKSILAYNADINTVTHFHRMGGALDEGGYSGDLGFDFSTDGGQTFTNMVECYVAENNTGGTYFADAARYPNHGIYNPVGNMDPANAYVAFYVPTLDASNSQGNSGWGGHGYGVASLGDLTSNTKHLVSSNPGDNIYRYIPDAFTVTNTGDAWMVDINQDWTSGSLIYTGYLLVSHGTWNSELNDFEYEEFLLDCPVTADLVRPSMAKVEFSPDGQTGYIVVLGDNGSLEFGANTIYPIIWKTTNGGEDWEDPIAVQLAGPDGIESIMYYISDEEWEELWQPPAPEREEVPYTTAFDCDLTVDANGNPHIAVGISVAGSDPYSIISANPYYAIADIWSPDGGEEWDAYIIDRPMQFRSTINADYSEDSRTQIARTHDGNYVFVGYLDTSKEGEEGNNFPDIYCRAIDVNYGWMSEYEGQDEATNVTFLSDGMEQAYFFAMASEVIHNNSGEAVVPFTYEEMNVYDPGEQVQYKYIQDFAFTDLPDGMEEMAEASTFEVAQNYPNPFNGQTDINVTLTKTAELSLNVYNLMGQSVYAANAGEVSGSYTFALNVDLEPGVYFYAVTAGTKTISKKMIVE
ncbi:MAG: hypothetical protein CSA95_05430 [Bacteroidetes bacterium]|nr:MAG: hypothetical protein CSA95_05430 [Bacteroidota bacterium]